MERSRRQLVAGMVIGVLGACIITASFSRIWDRLFLVIFCLPFLCVGTWLVDGFAKRRIPLQNWGLLGVVFVAGTLLSPRPSLFYNALAWILAGHNCWIALKQLTPPKPMSPDGLSPDLTHQ